MPDRVSTRSDSRPQWVYKALLLAAPVIWGVSFVFMKNSVDVLGPATLIGVRFLLSAVLMLACFGKRIRRSFDKDHLKTGVVLGVFMFLAFWTQTIGITDTTPGKNAFLTASYVVFVPFVFWLISLRKPGLLNIVAAFICLAGIGLVSLNGDLSIGYGDAMTLVCAVLFAFHIAFLGKYAFGRDIYTLAFMQFLVAGVLGLLLGLPTEALPRADLITPDFLGQMAYLVIGASFLALLFQNIGQAHVPPSQASIFLSLEAVFGVVFSVLLYGEEMSVKLVSGFVLIFVAIFINEVVAPKLFVKRVIVAHGRQTRDKD